MYSCFIFSIFRRHGSTQSRIIGIDSVVVVVKVVVLVCSPRSEFPSAKKIKIKSLEKKKCHSIYLLMYDSQ